MTPEQQEAAAKMAYEELTQDRWEVLVNKHIWRDLIADVDKGLGGNPQNGQERAALKAYQTLIALAPGSVDIGPILVAGELAKAVDPDPEEVPPVKKSGKSKS